MRISDLPFFSAFYEDTGRLIMTGVVDIPEEILLFRDMIHILDLTGSPIREIPEWVVWLRSLSALFVWKTALTRLPPVLSQCMRLRILSCKDGNIAWIDEDFIFPPNLEWLILTNNPKITHLPESIGRLSHLKKLALAGTGLSELPESLKNCKNLEFLRISACQFSSIPHWINTFSKLAWYADGGNPCSMKSTLLQSDREIDIADTWEWEMVHESNISRVSRARLRSSGQDIAIKTFKSSITSDGYALDDIGASLTLWKHENIISTLGFVSASPDDTDRALPRLVSLYIPDTYQKLAGPPSLESCTRDIFPLEKTFTIDYIVQVLSGVLSACAYIHTIGVSHGDLYAHNILVNEEWHAILTDFWAATRYEVRTMSSLYEQCDLRAFGHLMRELLDRVQRYGEADVRKSTLESLWQKYFSEESRESATFQSIVNEFLNWENMMKYWVG